MEVSEGENLTELSVPYLGAGQLQSEVPIGALQQIRNSVLRYGLSVCRELLKAAFGQGVEQ